MIIAVDFDGTLCVDKYPQIGAPIFPTINYIMHRKRFGDTIILWTCRKGRLLTEAVKWCEKYGVTFDYINKNAPEIKKRYGGDSRKIYADLYIDDKSVVEVREYSNYFDLLCQIARHVNI